MEGETMTTDSYYDGNCMLCPRMCGVDRIHGTRGYCGASSQIRVARAALHLWEEPCISIGRGSGTVFFSGCTLRCCFCQNHTVSHGCFGADITEDRLAEIFLSLQEQGAANINLVTATPYIPQIVRVLDKIRGQTLTIPIVWNSGGYERVESLHCLDGYIDVYLPDLKYHDSIRSERYSDAADYFSIAIEAIGEMVSQRGEYRFHENGALVNGVMVRHLVMPGGHHDSIRVIKALGERFSEKQILLSLMSQYTPFYRSCDYPEINRRITSFEYRSVCDMVHEYGFSGYFQEKSSAKEEYTPPFDLEGVL